MRMLRRFFLLASLCFPVAANAGSLPVRGINLLSADWQNDCRAIDAAASSGLNHLQLSHKIVHNLCEIRDTAKLGLVSRLSGYAHDAGITEVCLWDHALYDTDYYPPAFYYPGTGLLDLDKPELWEWIKSDYRSMLDACPCVDGLVLTFVESGARVEDQFSSMTVSERLAKVINTVSEVVCGEHGKTLWLRTFAYNAKEYEDITGCFSLVEWREGMGLMVKDVPHDFFLHHPDNPYIGKLGHPTLVEFDACGEYNGQNVILNALPDYFCERWHRYAPMPEVVGYVARTSRYGDDEVTGTPAEINLYALKRASEDAEVTVEEIYLDFIGDHYSRERKALKHLVPALKASRDIIEGTMYILGLNTTHHSNFVLDDPSTYSRHCSGRWTESPETHLGHGIDKDFHWWKDIVNTLAPLSCKTLDPKRAADISEVLDAGWLSDRDEMTEEWLDYVIKWTDDCHRKAVKGYRHLRRAEKYLPVESYQQLSDCYERSLMCLDLRRHAAVCWWGTRVWNNDTMFHTETLRRKLMRASKGLSKDLEKYDSYGKPYPAGTWDWKKDIIFAKECLEGATIILER